MSVVDIIITFVIWLYKSTILAILPTEIGFLPYNTFTAYLGGLETNLVYAFSGIYKLFPIDLLLILVLVILTGEGILFLVKIATFVINIIRGSGA